MLEITIKYLLSWLSYPLVIIAGVVSHFFLLDLGTSLALATYVPVIFGALFITLMEWFNPYRRQWHPPVHEVKDDVLYMLLVQILLPRLLGFFIAYTLLIEWGAEDGFLHEVWIHDWPIGLQAIMMILIADFLRYWVHRAAHQYSFLWRLHAVHHSTDKLYWINTGRFHPVDKALQFVFDALPFIVLGVKPEVLSLYFVFYALNGFFQHSNINLRFGVLNYIFSTAELHRWHHSKSIEESSTNYGNNIIIWDLLFGTWFLPKDKQVTTLGLYNPQYPMSFMAQLKAPFTVGLDKRPIMMLGFKAIIQNIISLLTLQIVRLLYWWPFQWATRQPLDYQQRVLMRIVQANKESEFGQLHHFNAINNVKEFQSEVPIQNYSTLRPFIDKQISGIENVLTKVRPFYYARTSGTTGDPKYIPVITDTVKQHQRALAMFSYLQYRAQRQAFSGALVAIPGPYEEGKFDSGVSYGSISGLMYTLMPAHLKDKYVIPASVFSIEDYQLKYRMMLRLMLPQANLSYIASANPTTFKKLQDVLNHNWETFLADLEFGGFHDVDKLPENVRDDVMPLLKASSVRHKQLQRLVTPVHFKDVWPNIRLVVTWMGGSCGIAVDHIKSSFPSDSVFMDLGFLSSEMRATITVDKSRNGGIPTLKDHFFEFIEVSDYEQGQRDTLSLNKLDVGKQYYLIVTTSAGLYRYFMNDIIEVTGTYNATPLLTFIQKGKGVTNITGEKLSEQQIITALEKVKKNYDINIPFYLALACVEQARYLLYVELNDQGISEDEIIESIEQQLYKSNVEYASKRDSGRLHPLEVKLVKQGTAEAYKQYCLDKGQRESQYKPLLLQYQSDTNFPFEKYLNKIYLDEQN